MTEEDMSRIWATFAEESQPLMRPEWLRRPYITFWRPDDAGYVYPLSWAGDYSRNEVVAGGNYYRAKNGRWLIRFAVPRSVAEAMATGPNKGEIDGDAGPAVPNTPKNRANLRRAAFTPDDSKEAGQ